VLRPRPLEGEGEAACDDEKRAEDERGPDGFVEERERDRNGDERRRADGDRGP
jgi:hypothetical protein